MAKKGSVTRIVKLDKQHNVMVGQDLSGIFEDGMIYDVRKVLGEFVLTPIGKSAHMTVAKKRFPKWKGSDPRTKSQILMDGTTYITEEEYKAEKQHHESEY